MKLPSPKKAVAFQAYSSLIKDFQDLDNSWSFALILRGEWQHGEGTALHWGTDVLPQPPVHPRAPLMAPGETETCPGAEISPPAPPIPA